MLKKFGDLVPGDIIRGADGREVKVVAAHDWHVPQTMYELELEDGSTLKASGNHLWYIETEFDYSLHRKRRADGKRLFKNISEEGMDLLIEQASFEDYTETALMDMVALADAVGNPEATQALVRIAESIGHVAENNQALEDLASGEILESVLVRTYDAKVFSQQILSLTGKREYKKRWPLIVGRVVTTEDIVNFYGDSDIPVMNKLS
jgi:hypothetical protein